MAMRSEPAVLMAAASPSLSLAISPELSALARAKMTISDTATPARAGNEPFHHQRFVTATSKELATPAGRVRLSRVKCNPLNRNGKICRFGVTPFGVGAPILGARGPGSP